MTIAQHSRIRRSENSRGRYGVVACQAVYLGADAQLL